VLVSELQKAVDAGRESTLVTRLGDAEVASEGLKISGEDDVIGLDGVGLLKLSKYLRVPYRYLERCPEELVAANLNFWLQHRPDDRAMFHVLGGNLHAVHRPDAKVFPVTRLAEVISNTFQPDDEVKTLRSDTYYLHADVISRDHRIEVPGIGREDLGRKVGDVTHGGLRFFAYPMRERRPYLQTYLHRLVCSNGQAIDEPELHVELRGHTFSEVLAELEHKAQLVMEGLPQRLAQYKASADVIIPGDLEQFIYRLGRERGLGSRVMNRVMERSAELPDDPSVYDVTQVFTSVANEDLPYRAQLRLQRIGGDLSTRTEQMLSLIGAQLVHLADPHEAWGRPWTWEDSGQASIQLVSTTNRG
jgi:hypothetical protein